MPHPRGVCKGGDCGAFLPTDHVTTSHFRNLILHPLKPHNGWGTRYIIGIRLRQLLRESHDPPRRPKLSHSLTASESWLYIYPHLRYLFSRLRSGLLNLLQAKFHVAVA